MCEFCNHLEWDVYSCVLSDSNCAKIDWNYCPMCGKPLQSKSLQNKPLTMDEIMQMDGQRVWVVDKSGLEYDDWHIVNVVLETFDDNYGRCFNFADYGELYFVLKEKPAD